MAVNKNSANADTKEASDEADAQRQRCAGDHHGQQVTSLPVGAERIIPGRRLQGRNGQRLGVGSINREGADHHEHCQQAQQDQADHQRRVATKIAAHRQLCR